MTNSAPPTLYTLPGTAIGRWLSSGYKRILSLAATATTTTRIHRFTGGGH